MEKVNKIHYHDTVDGEITYVSTCFIDGGHSMFMLNTETQVIHKLDHARLNVMDIPGVGEGYLFLMEGNRLYNFSLNVKSATKKFLTHVQRCIGSE